MRSKHLYFFTAILLQTLVSLNGSISYRNQLVQSSFQTKSVPRYFHRPRIIRRRKRPIQESKNLTRRYLSLSPSTIPTSDLESSGAKKKMSSTTKKTLNKNAKILSVFTIVTFKNDDCNSASGTNGTCYSSSDCSNLSGAASGSCAAGFGVCCTFIKTCGSSTSSNCTYFQSPGYPSANNLVGSCQITVIKLSDNICQLRLDFVNFVTAQPDSTDNNCLTDQLVIAGTNIPAICGTNTGQHIYTEVGPGSTGPVTINMVTGTTTSSRSFSIRICQIECNSPSKASDGCLQYFTGVGGQLQTFNYLNAAGLQLSKTDYTMCVRMEKNFCGIQYSPCIDSVNAISMAFSVSTGPGTNVETVCSNDWVTIPCATNTMDVSMQVLTAGSTAATSSCVDRICGMTLNSVASISTISMAINSFVKPFTVHVHTNGKEGSDSPVDSNNRGFCLNYVQIPCTSGVVSYAYGNAKRL